MVDTGIEFKIDDSGKGMTEEQKQKLFIPFSNDYDKLNTMSSGLGLSIVKDLVEMLGGEIKYESALSKGSSFWFTIRLDKSDLERRDSNTTPVGHGFSDIPIQTRLNRCVNHQMKKMIVIVVDDEVVTRQSTIRQLEKYLRGRNWETNILEAGDGIECLHLYYRLIKEGKKIDFILSDETMIYMNGMVSANIVYDIEVNKNIPHVLFYILTAYEDLTLGYANRAIDGIFSKPLRKQNIDEIINKINT
jgi:CheY-like chemotaxis protein